MFKNYFKVALRNLRKRKSFAIINILSLALGITGGIFMLVYTLDEFSFDNFHEKSDRIYRVNTVFIDNKSGSESANDANGWPVGKVLEEEYPEVETVIYLKSRPSLEVSIGKEKFTQSMYYVSEDMLDVFSFDMIKGNPTTALDEPNSIVITEEMEQKFFKGADGLYQTMMLMDTIPMKVTGILKDIPSNSHMQFDLLVSLSTVEDLLGMSDYHSGWGNINLHNYVLLKEGVDAEAFQQKAKNIYMEKVGDMMKSWGTEAFLTFDPLSDIYLRSDAGNGLGPVGSIDRVYLVMGICLFTILLACINFINLSTARSVDRSKEVGLRKVVGSSRKALITQFMVEAFLLTILGFVLAVMLASMMMPVFNDLLNKSYNLQLLIQPQILLAVIVLILSIAFFAGYFPALHLSALQPIKVLKGKFVAASGGIQMRKVLVVFQFFISVSLALGTFIVLDQLEFMQNKELGFAKEEVFVINAAKIPKAQINAFKNELSKIPGIKTVSYSNGIPGRPGWIGQIAYPEGREAENPVSLEYLAVDENYINTLDLEIIAGRNFDPNRETDMTEGLVLNEKAVELLGWESPEAALGQRIVSPSTTPQGTVIGVVKDFHQLGLQRQIHGIAMDAEPIYAYWVSLRFDPSNTTQVLEDVNKLWVSNFAEFDYSYFFLNEDFERLYLSELRLSKMFKLFSGLTLLISVIGLVGLVSFMIESRKKEMSIRKVLGAGISQIVSQLSREFLVLVCLAAMISIPVVWYFGKDWLENFAYSAPLKPVSFGLAIMIAISITLVVVLFQALRAAKGNTVNGLRSE